MNNPNKQEGADPSADNIFRPSKFLTLRRKPQVRGQPTPNILPSQSEGQHANPAPRAQSEDKKPKLVPNSKNARKRDLSYDQSQDAMEEEIVSKKGPKIVQSNLLTSKKEGGNVNTKGPSVQRIRTSTKGVAFGGMMGDQLISKERKKEKKINIFDTNLDNESLYAGRKFLFPVEIKFKPEEAKTEALIQEEGKEVLDQDKDQEILNALQKDFCFFQLPANLPIEGCYQLTPKTEDIDTDINTDDLLTSFLSNKFDSTGFHLERDFKLLKENQRDKMVEETEKAPNMRDKLPQNKQYETYKIGKLCRMRNGEIKMRIGNTFFDVTQGVQDSFYKELFVIDYTEKSAMSLGPIKEKFVVKPNMESFY